MTNSPTPTRVYSKKGSRVFPNHLVRHLQRLHVIDLESPVIVTQKLERLYRHGDSYLRSGITFPMATHSIVPSSCYRQSCWIGFDAQPAEGLGLNSVVPPFINARFPIRLN